jgi:hypothetical protein
MKSGQHQAALAPLGLTLGVEQAVAEEAEEPCAFERAALDDLGPVGDEDLLHQVGMLEQHHVFPPEAGVIHAAGLQAEPREKTQWIVPATEKSQQGDPTGAGRKS